MEPPPPDADEDETEHVEPPVGPWDEVASVALPPAVAVALPTGRGHPYAPVAP